MTRREPRTSMLRIRYTKEEKIRIEDAADSAGLMTSEFVRLAIEHAVKHGISFPKVIAPVGEGIADLLTTN